MTSYGIQAMNYQHQITSPFQTTPIYTDMDDNVRLGPGLHFYFGLMPGATAYDIFLEKVEIAKTKGVTIEYSLKVDTFVPSWEITLLNNTLSVDELDELTTEA